MIYSKSAVSKKYAQAFLNVYQDNLTLEQIRNFKLAVIFFRQHHNFLSIIGQLVGRQEGFEQLLSEMHEHFALPDSVKKLLQLLIEHKRVSLFALILQDIHCLYMLKNNILELTIKTAQPLELEQQQKFEQFFAKLSKKKILTNVEIDESLIAGVRLQSDFFLWEHSIKSKITDLSKKMLDEQ